MATRVQIVVTPGSGAGGAMSVANRVRQGLAAQGYAPSVRAFRTLGELERWTRTCAPTFSHLVAVGGDATISAAAAAAVRLAVPFVPVPSGLGTLFTSAFEHPHEPPESSISWDKAIWCGPTWDSSPARCSCRTRATASSRESSKRSRRCDGRASASCACFLGRARAAHLRRSAEPARHGDHLRPQAASRRAAARGVGVALVRGGASAPWEPS